MRAALAFLRRHPGPLLVLATAFVFGVAYLAAAGNGWGTYRRLSQAMLAGRLDIDARQLDPGHLRDLAVFQGRYYYPMGVLPALVLLPGVAALGVDFPQGVLVVALAVAMGGLTYRLARRLGYGERDALWVVVALLLASPLAYLVLRATVFDTYLTHLLTLTCLLAALAEYLGRRRWWLLGALVGLSTLARPLTVVAVPSSSSWPRVAATMRPGGKKLIA